MNLSPTNVEQNGASTLSDESLVRLAKRELPYQTAAFKELMTRYKDKVFAKATSMLDNEEDARDITQDVFIKVLNNLPKFAMKAAFSTWLYIITVNTCLSHLDKRKRNPHWWMTEDIDDVQLAHKEEEEIFNIMGQGVERRGLRECIEGTLQDLGSDHRRILELRFLEELDYREVAEKLNIKLSAAKMRLKRARQAFREEFEQQCMGK